MNTYITWKSHGKVATLNTMEVLAPRPTLYKKQAIQVAIFYFAFFLLNCTVGYFNPGPARIVSIFLPIGLALVIFQSALCRGKAATWLNFCFFIMLNFEAFEVNGYYREEPICIISCLCLFLLASYLFKISLAKWLSIAVICLNMILIKIFCSTSFHWLSGVEISVVLVVASALMLHHNVEIQQERRELLVRIDSMGIQLSKAQENLKRQRIYFAETYHEVRSAFMGVLALLGELSAYNNDSKNVVQYESFRVLRPAVSNLRAVLDNLLDYAKVEEGVPETVNIELTEIQEVFIGLVDVMHRDAKHRGIKIDLQFDDDLPQVIDADELKIRKIATNLISNAIKYSNDNSTVTVEIGVVDCYWYMVVSDEGVGIPEDRRQDIFEPFVVINNSSKRNIEQMGIGLAIVEKLVQVLGAKITVWSELNVGTRFTVSFPLNMSIYEEA